MKQKQRPILFTILFAIILFSSAAYSREHRHIDLDQVVKSDCTDCDESPRAKLAEHYKSQLAENLLGAEISISSQGFVYVLQPMVEFPIGGNGVEAFPLVYDKPSGKNICSLLKTDYIGITPTGGASTVKYTYPRTGVPMLETKDADSARLITCRTKIPPKEQWVLIEHNNILRAAGSFIEHLGIRRIEQDANGQLELHLIAERISGIVHETTNGKPNFPGITLRSNANMTLRNEAAAESNNIEAP